MKEIFFNIIYFPLPILWALIIAIILSKKTYIYYYIKLICLFLYISLTPLFAQLIELPLKYNSNIYDKNANIKLILVPTAGIYKDEQMKWHLSSNSVLRISKGEALARSLNKPLLISGGVVNGNAVSEAAVSKDLISYKNTFYDSTSKNSYETALNLKNFIDDIMPNEKVLIVTNPKHSLRMSLLLNSKGYENVLYPDNKNNIFNFFSILPDSRSVNSINASIYEYLALVKYIFMGYIKL